MTAKNNVATTERPNSVKMFFTIFEKGSCQAQTGDNQVNKFDADERQDDAPEAVNQQVDAQDLHRAERAEFDAAQSQRYQRDDDERVENHRAQNRAVRAMQV